MTLLSDYSFSKDVSERGNKEFLPVIPCSMTFCFPECEIVLQPL